MKQLNRHILKLLMLFVGLFAISNVGWSWDWVTYFTANSDYLSKFGHPQVEWTQNDSDNKGWAVMTQVPGTNVWRAEIKGAPDWFKIIVTTSKDWSNNERTYEWENANQKNGQLFTITSYNSTNKMYGMSESNSQYSVPSFTGKYYLYIFQGSTYKTKIELKNNTDVTIDANTYKNCSFLVQTEGNSITTWHKMANSSKSNKTTTYNLTGENDGNDMGPLPSISEGEFTFRLSLSGIFPNTLTVTEPTPQAYWELFSDFDGDGQWEPKPVKWPQDKNDNSEAVWENFYIKDNEGKFAIRYNDGEGHYTYYTTNLSNDPDVIEAGWIAKNTSSKQMNMKFKGWTRDTKYSLYFLDKEGDNARYKIWFNATARPQPSLVTDQSRKGKVYLVGNVINNNTPSPAWEMTGTTNVKTIGNFAMRYNDNLGVVVYNESGIPTYYDKTDDVTQPTKEVGGAKKGDYYSQAGWTYSASWNGSTLTLTPSTFSLNNKMLPYVGVLGLNFKQRTAHPTYYAGSNGWPTHVARNARDGWQEAYIEYGSNGAPIIKADNHAYYNTVWPPRHNILMESEIDGDKLNITSSELSLKPDANRQTGSAWIEDLYGTTQNVKNEEYEGLKLEAGRTYARYVVNNMWMQGPFKIWTGWGGQEEDWGANWDTHIYWGSTEEALNKQNKKDDKGNRINDLDVKAGTTYDAKNEGGGNNYLTQDRAFFQTMELFIPVDNTNGFDFNGAKLYMTEAPGGAQIDAVANNAEVGYYPSITSWPTDYKMTSYRITRYAYDASVPSEKFADELWACTRKRDEAQYGSSAATVKTHDYGSYENGITEEEFKALFANFWGNGGEYVLEGTYDPGRYIFRLQVTFANQEDTKTKSADVWSPYVEIITTGYTTDLDTYQLIELPAGNSYKYITYDPDGNYRGVNLKDDGESVASIKSLTLNDEDAQEILEITGKWTNKVLFISRVPVNFEQQTADLRDIRSFTVVDGNDATTKILDLKPYNETYYMAVKNLSTDLNLKEYKSAFTGYIELAGENNTSTFTPTGTMDEPIEYYPHFMLPAFGKALLSFDADGNKTKEFTASHEDITTLEGTETQQGGITTNRHMLQADIEVLMPNISTTEGNELKTAVFNALSYNISKNDPDGGASTSYPISADNNESKFGLSYKYQNPYDWMKYAEGQGIEGCDWVGKTHVWTITDAKYANTTAISGITPTLNGQTATITAQPKFKAPVLTSDGTAYGYSFEEDETTGWTIFDVWIEQSNIEINNGDNFDTNPKTEVMMGQDENVAFLVKVVLPEKYLKEDQDLSIISQVMPYETANDPAYRHSILHLYRWYDKNYYNYINELMEKLQIEVAYAYYFSAGGEAGSSSTSADQNAKISTSNYIGLSSTAGFPNIRYDHQDGQKNGKMSVKRRAEGEYSEENPSETLTTGDNAFLLAPQYTVIKYADETNNGIPTGIEGIGYDNAGSIRAGQGFIEVEGQSVAIYNASGICIATAEGRYDVAPGVYVVRLNGATSKVLVK